MDMAMIIPSHMSTVICLFSFSGIGIVTVVIVVIISMDGQMKQRVIHLVMQIIHRSVEGIIVTVYTRQVSTHKNNGDPLIPSL